MYGPNYSGFAFRPKAVRMVGSVHFGDFLVGNTQICRAGAVSALSVSDSTHIFGPVQSMCEPRTPRCLWPAQHFEPVAVRPPPHSISAGCPGTCPLKCSMVDLWNQPARHRTALPTVPARLIPGLEPSAHRRSSLLTNKNGVFHVKHAARFPSTAPAIKPSSSPTQDTSRSHADSAQARPPALPAQTRPSPAHSHSRRSAAPPVHSARSAASPRRCRATR